MRHRQCPYCGYCNLCLINTGHCQVERSWSVNITARITIESAFFEMFCVVRRINFLTIALLICICILLYIICMYFLCVRPSWYYGTDCRYDSFGFYTGEVNNLYFHVLATLNMYCFEFGRKALNGVSWHLVDST